MIYSHFHFGTTASSGHPRAGIEKSIRQSPATEKRRRLLPQDHAILTVCAEISFSFTPPPRSLPPLPLSLSAVKHTHTFHFLTGREVGRPPPLLLSQSADEKRTRRVGRQEAGEVVVVGEVTEA